MIQEAIAKLSVHLMTRFDKISSEQIWTWTD